MAITSTPCNHARPVTPKSVGRGGTISRWASKLQSHEGRPTKIEGNPDHPASPGGATDVFTQAAILDLYDPDRSQSVLRDGEVASWERFFAELTPLLAAQSAKAGAGLRILTETITSPTLAGQLDALLRKYPQARWHQFEPVNLDRSQEGARLSR